MPELTEVLNIGAKWRVWNRFSAKKKMFFLPDNND